MNNLEKLGIISGELKIRTCVDDSGDYERKTYDILNCFPWGSNLITTDIDNPKHARLFVYSSKMFDTLIEGIRFNEKHGLACEALYKAVEEATDMSWKEIEESLKNV